VDTLPAEEWLESHPLSPEMASAQPGFQRFLNERSPSADIEKDRLYAEYLKWQRERGLNPAPSATGSTR
jgi:hypothetical protein